jgi:ribosomal protein L37AE/L43A
MKVKINCPKCNKEIEGEPACSREVNKVKICSDCGLKEAIAMYTSFYKSNNKIQDLKN